ncbi:uncharacterized protein LOC101847540 [Aplysia californica]|uniref:Uncharacterized protein LOC101847540 n=1 Tax=Aplysia californica TaxID=6500 RepID=A0ABM0K844_APLCA|nr:uncharacterized protein LOC101847540 [Aplysia californica]
MLPSSRFSFLVLLVSVLTLHYGASDDTDPYVPGPYKTAEFTITPADDGAPMHTTVYFPLTHGTFKPIIFIGGFNGMMSAEYYSVLMHAVAAHGYVVIGMEAMHPYPPEMVFKAHSRRPSKVHGTWDFGVSDLENAYQKYFNQTAWLQANINNRTYAIPDWNQKVLMCHSSSCDYTMEMINQDNEFAKASVFIDPVSAHSVEMKPIPAKVMTLAYMSQLSERFPDCCIPGLGYKKIYSLMTCVKVRMQAQNMGHCDVLDRELWDMCHKTHVCRSTDSKHLPAYRAFIAGAIHGFLRWTLDGHKENMKYLTEQQFIPFNLTDIAYNTTCDH